MISLAVSRASGSVAAALLMPPTTNRTANPNQSLANHTFLIEHHNHTSRAALKQAIVKPFLHDLSSLPGLPPLPRKFLGLERRRFLRVELGSQRWCAFNPSQVIQPQELESPFFAPPMPT